MDSTLSDLVDRFRAGDRDAGDELYQRYAGEMLNLVRRRLSSSRNRAAIDSRDVLQDGFKSFFSAIQKPTFDPRRFSIGGLLNTIVSRKAFAHLRRRYPENITPDDVDLRQEVTAALVDAQFSEPEMDATVRELEATLLEEFTEKERLVLEHFLDPWSDASPESIAAVCHRSIRTVREVIDRFIRRLRQLAAQGSDSRGAE